MASIVCWLDFVLFLPILDLKQYFKVLTEKKLYTDVKQLYLLCFIFYFL